jgi:hypothetical protein
MLALTMYGLGGLARCVYNGWWLGAVFTAVWIAALVVMFGPSSGLAAS